MNCPLLSRFFCTMLHFRMLFAMLSNPPTSNATVKDEYATLLLLPNIVRMLPSMLYAHFICLWTVLMPI
jgi:hypothetical protein